MFQEGIGLVAFIWPCDSDAARDYGGVSLKQGSDVNSVVTLQKKHNIGKYTGNK